MAIIKVLIGFFRYILGYLLVIFLNKLFPTYFTDSGTDFAYFLAVLLTIGLVIKTIVAIFLKIETYEIKLLKKDSKA